MSKKMQTIDPAERVKIAQMQSEIKQESDKKMEWLYSGNKIDRDAYLLGKPINKLLIEKEQEENKESEYQTSIIDLANKIREDPLFEIKKQEIEAKKKILENPLKMKQLEQMISKSSKKRSSSESSDSDSEHRRRKEKKNYKKSKKYHKKSKYSDSQEESDEERRRKRTKIREWNYRQRSRSNERSHRQRSRSRERSHRQRSKSHERSHRQRSKSHERSHRQRSKSHERSHRQRSRSRERSHRQRSKSHERSHRQRSRSRERSRERIKPGYGLKQSREKNFEKRDEKERDEKHHSSSRSKNHLEVLEYKNRIKKLETIRKSEVSQNVTTKKLTDEEKQNRLKEMQDNAKWRQEVREKNIRNHKYEEKKEEELEKKSKSSRMQSEAALLFNSMMNEAYASTEDRIKRNVNKVQKRSTSSLE